MLSLKDLNELLEKIPVWRRMIGAADRIDALEERLSAIEKQFAGRVGPGDPCPFCRRPSGDLQEIIPDVTFGKRMLWGRYICAECHKEYTHEVTM